MAGNRRAGSFSRELSLWALLARSSLYKIMAVLALMAGAEILLFLDSLKQGRKSDIEGLINDSLAPVVFLTALGLLFLILVYTESRMNTRSRYTLLRLGTSFRHFWVVTIIYNILCILLLLALQVWLGVWMTELYQTRAALEYPAPQLLFLAFYRSEFLHCLLPLAEIGKWVRNVLLLMSLALEAAYPAGRKSYVVPIGLYVLAASTFVSSVGINLLDVLCDITCGTIVLVEALRFFRYGRESI